MLFWEWGPVSIHGRWNGRFVKCPLCTISREILRYPEKSPYFQMLTDEERFTVLILSWHGGIEAGNFPNSRPHFYFICKCAFPQTKRILPAVWARLLFNVRPPLGVSAWVKRHSLFNLANLSSSGGWVWRPKAFKGKFCINENEF